MFMISLNTCFKVPNEWIKSKCAKRKESSPWINNDGNLLEFMVRPSNCRSISPIPQNIKAAATFLFALFLKAQYKAGNVLKNVRRRIVFWFNWTETTRAPSSEGRIVVKIWYCIRAYGIAKASVVVRMAVGSVVDFNWPGWCGFDGHTRKIIW